MYFELVCKNCRSTRVNVQRELSGCADIECCGGVQVALYGVCQNCHTRGRIDLDEE